MFVSVQGRKEAHLDSGLANSKKVVVARKTGMPTLLLKLRAQSWTCSGLTKCQIVGILEE